MITSRMGIEKYVHYIVKWRGITLGTWTKGLDAVTKADRNPGSIVEAVIYDVSPPDWAREKGARPLVEPREVSRRVVYSS